jgi:hypothetical protein
MAAKGVLTTAANDILTTAANDILTTAAKIVLIIFGRKGYGLPKGLAP